MQDQILSGHTRCGPTSRRPKDESTCRTDDSRTVHEHRHRSAVFCARLMDRGKTDDCVDVLALIEMNCRKNRRTQADLRGPKVEHKWMKGSIDWNRPWNDVLIASGMMPTLTFSALTGGYHPVTVVASSLGERRRASNWRISSSYV